MTSLIWFRDDLRLHDHPALTAATSRGAVLAVVVDEPTYPGTRPLGAASQWWRERSIRALAKDLAGHGVPLLRLAGDPRQLLPQLAAQHGINMVTWTRRYHGPLREVDAAVKSKLTAQGVSAQSFPGHTIVEPWEVLTKAGDPYKVFTPFSKAARLQARDDTPLPVPPLTGAHVDAPPLGSPEEPHWAAGFDIWTPGETAARERAGGFLERLDGYAEDRDFPAQPATSRLSPHLRFGEISVRELYGEAMGTGSHDAEKFCSELLWRDFAWHRLYHLPNMATHNVREQFDRFDWASADQAPEELAAWQQGRTGIPLVDAGMHELWTTGYMHNRVRMVVGSFLTKNLGIHWRHGEEWFWDCLVDADPASNPFGWQWVAGSGDDAAPFFRIFNPETQAARFDPDGSYIARWAPSGTSEPLVDL